jgi:hypothetical protein
MARYDQHVAEQALHAAESCSGRTYYGMNRLGCQTQFYFATIRSVGDAIVRYERETVRLITVESSVVVHLPAP